MVVPLALKCPASIEPQDPLRLARLAERKGKKKKESEETAAEAR